MPLFSISSSSVGGAAYAVLKEPVTCGCRRATCFVNRDGRSRCLECDAEYLEEQAKDAANEAASTADYQDAVRKGY